MAGMRARKQLTQDMVVGGGGAGLEHVLSCKHMKISRGGKLEVCVRLRGHSLLSLETDVLQSASSHSHLIDSDLTIV